MQYLIVLKMICFIYLSIAAITSFFLLIDLQLYVLYKQTLLIFYDLNRSRYGHHVEREDSIVNVFSNAFISDFKTMCSFVSVYILCASICCFYINKKIKTCVYLSFFLLNIYNQTIQNCAI